MNKEAREEDQFVLDETGDRFAADLYRHYQEQNLPYARCRNLSDLTFSLIADYDVCGAEGVDYIVSRLEGSDMSAKRDAMKSVFLGLQASRRAPKFRAIPPEQIGRLLNSVERLFNEDPDASFMAEKISPQDGGVHIVAQQMLYYLAHQDAKIEEKPLRLFEKLLRASLKRMESHGAEGLFGNNFPFSGMAENLQKPGALPLVEIFRGNASGITTIMDAIEREIQKGKAAYYHSYEHQEIHALRRVLS